MPNSERGSCRFNLRKTTGGKPLIEMEMFHNTVPLLAAVTLSFEVLGGITIEQTRDLIEQMNDQIVEWPSRRGSLLPRNESMGLRQKRTIRRLRRDSRSGGTTFQSEIAALGGSHVPGVLRSDERHAEEIDFLLQIT